MNREDCRRLQNVLDLGSVTGLVGEPRHDLRTCADWTATNKHVHDFKKDIEHFRYYTAISVLTGSPLSYGGIRLADGYQRLDRARMNGLLNLKLVSCNDDKQVFELTDEGRHVLGVG